MKNLLFFIVIVLVFSSCAKDKPPVGDYIGTFMGTYTRDSIIRDYSMVYILQIIESGKTSLSLQYKYTISELTKDKHKVKGTLDFIEIRGSTEGHVYGPIDVSGSWIKENDSYTISGDFSRLYKIINSIDRTVFEFPISGTFEIKSDF